MRNRIKNTIKILLFCTPYIIGTTGYIMSGASVLNSLFWGAELYLMNMTEEAPNIVVEIARWIAPLATAGGVLLIIVSIWESFRNRIRYLKGNSVAVYGPDENKKAMLDRLDERGIEGKDSFVKAHKYILLGNETDNFRFYTENKEALKGKNVYLKCSSLPEQSSSDPDLRLFSPEETAARQYWKERSLIKHSFEKNHKLKIVFIGFERLGEELLTFGLQQNIFTPEQRIEYHIFGDGIEFVNIHHNIAAISDPVIFHEEEWHTNLNLIENADRVIVITQDNQLSILKKLLLATTRQKFDVFSSETGLELLSEQERIIPYFWKKEAEIPERIFSEELYEHAKKLNLRYANLYSKISETEENKELQWRKIDTFLRYSNISAADFQDIWLQILEITGKSAEECIEYLAELEHIRWCRYYFLNNWQYGIPKSGELKDTVKRIHKDLVPYKELPDTEKPKDRESIRVLMALRKNS